MINDEFTRLDAIRVFLNVADGRYHSLPWCTGCDFVWWSCTFMGHDINYRIELTGQEAVAALGRALGG